MKTALGLILAVGLSGSAAATENTPQPHRHSHHHKAQAATAQPVSPPVAPQPAQASGSGILGSMFRPYAHPGEGDDDGLSRDPDDCNKGCIGGNAQ